MPVVRSLKRDDLVAAREAPRDAHGRHRGLRAGADEAEEIDAPEPVLHRLGQPDLRLCGSTETRAVAGGAPDRTNDRGIRVTEQQRAPRHAKIEILLSVRVPER